MRICMAEHMALGADITGYSFVIRFLGEVRE